MDIHIRPARSSDVDALESLIDASVSEIVAQSYSAAQTAQARTHLFGVDTQLIADGTYYVAISEGDASTEAPSLVGAGGWSRRQTPFGGDQATEVQDPTLRDPATDPAILRAFFVHPDCTRQGIGRRLLHTCEGAARAEGYTHFELVATRSGVALYEACGYRSTTEITIDLPGSLTLPAVTMVKP